MEKYLYIIPIGFMAQYIDGTLGMGYGASSSSFLLAAGFGPAVVSASVHTAEIFASLAAGISHLKFGNVDRGIVVPLSITGSLGGVMGAIFLSSLTGALVRPFIALLLLLIGVKVFVIFCRKRLGNHVGGRFSRKLLLPLGLIGGAVDAIGGGGWGPICTPVLVTANRREPRYVVGSVNMAEFFTTTAIVITFAITLGLDKFLWGITVPLIIGGVVAAPMAAYSCRKISPRVLGVAIGVLLIGLNMHTAAPAFVMLGTKIPFNPLFGGGLVLAALISIVLVRRTSMKKVDL